MILDNNNFDRLLAILLTLYFTIYPSWPDWFISIVFTVLKI